MKDTQQWFYLEVQTPVGTVASRPKQIGDEITEIEIEELLEYIKDGPKYITFINTEGNKVIIPGKLLEQSFTEVVITAL